MGRPYEGCVCVGARHCLALFQHAAADGGRPMGRREEGCVCVGARHGLALFQPYEGARQSGAARYSQLLLQAGR
jgi:hypothetical protein